MGSCCLPSDSADYIEDIETDYYLFVRHGEAENNIGKIFAPNTKLTKNGVSDLQKIKTKLIEKQYYPNIKYVITSPLQYCLFF